MPFLLAEILNFQGSTHRIGVGSFSKLISEMLDIPLSAYRTIGFFLITNNSMTGIYSGSVVKTKI